MTLDEAIRHCNEVAEEKQLKANNLKQCKDYGNPKSTITSGVVKCETCAEQHRRLAEWLKELKAYKADEEHLKSCFYCGNRKSCKDYLEGVTSYACDDWEPCEDCISRQAAKAVVKKHFAQSIPWTSHPITEDLEALPSVNPTAKTGRWVAVTNGRGGHECSECGEYAPSFQSGREHLTNYCPNCGAKMEGEATE